MIAYVTPAVALGLGLVVRHEPIGPWTLAGLGAILAGVFLVHRGGVKTKAQVASASPSS